MTAFLNLALGLLVTLGIMAGVNGLGLIALLAATRRHESQRNPGRHRATPKHAATTGARR